MHSDIQDAKDIATLLQSQGVKASYQRLRIFEYLVHHRTHPTVDMIYTGLIDEIPTLSKTTVYNTLKLFSDKGLVSTITIEENENRYDVDVSNHGHFKCKQCGGVTDFMLDDHSIVIHELDGYRTEDRHVYFKGVCKNCLNRSKN